MSQTQPSPPRTKAQRARYLVRLLCSNKEIPTSQVRELMSGQDLGALLQCWAEEIPAGPVEEQNKENLDTLISEFKALDKAHAPQVHKIFDLFQEQDKWEALLCLVQRTDRQSSLEDVAQKILRTHPTDPPDRVRAVLSYLTCRIGEYIDKSLTKVVDESSDSAYTNSVFSAYMNSVLFSTHWNFGGMNQSMNLLHTLVHHLGSRVYSDTNLSDIFSNIEKNAQKALPSLNAEVGQEVASALEWIDSSKRKYKLTALADSSSTPAPTPRANPKI